MNAGRVARRIGRVIIHNWPLKLAAVVLASLLYAGIVASQDSDTITGPINITVENQPDGTAVTSELGDVESIQFIAPADVPRPRLDDFRATVDLSGVKPDANPANVRVEVTVIDPRIQVLDFTPRTVRVVLDEIATKAIPVIVDVSQPPEGITVGEIVVTPAEVEITGPSALVNTVVGARVSATIDASALNISRDVQPQAIDADGQAVSGINIEPALVRLEVPVYENLQNRTLPVNPVVTGRPGAGFRIASVTVDPQVVTVGGDLDQLAELVSADTAPVVVSGATRDVTAQVAFALPTGVTTIGDQVASVTVRIEAVTDTRTYTAGIRLDGRNPTLEYEPADTQVLLTLFGSTVDLDLLGASPIVISVNVADLEPGVHEVAVIPSVPSAVTVAAISPETITVTVTPRPTPTPEPMPTAQPEPTPALEPVPSP